MGKAKDSGSNYQKYKEQRRIQGTNTPTDPRLLPQQNRPASVPTPSSTSGPNAAQAIAENQARERQRLAALAEEERKKKEQARFEEVSKLEGEKRRKELEMESGAAAAAATGGQAFFKKEDKKAGTAKLSQPATVRAVAPPSAQGTILGLPKDTKVFTKFGESINRAANLTFSAPETRFGGI